MNIGNEILVGDNGVVVPDQTAYDAHRHKNKQCPEEWVDAADERVNGYHCGAKIVPATTQAMKISMRVSADGQEFTRSKTGGET